MKSELKKQYRRRYLAERLAMDPATHARLSERIFERLTNWSLYRDAHCIMCYISVRNEVDTWRIALDILSRGKPLGVPLIDPAHRSMIASQIGNPESDLAQGYYGLWQPPAGKTMPVDQGNIDLYLVPGVAWNTNGIRIGYGGGYFDRFLLKRAPWSHVVGLAFESQIDDTLPVDIWDIPADMLVTEERIIDCRFENLLSPPMSKRPS